MSGTDRLGQYFLEFFRMSHGILDRMPIRLTPQPMSYVSDVLERAAEERRVEEAARLREVVRVPHQPADHDFPVGLNTIGILADRLTILAIKTWFLRHKHKKDEAAAVIEADEVVQIVRAMSLTRPGSATLLQKITELKTVIHNADWAESFYGLLMSNLMMWEAQESMYVNNMADYSDAEVRACLSWCSYGNQRRNRYITSCEVLYWQTP